MKGEANSNKLDRFAFVDTIATGLSDPLTPGYRYRAMLVSGSASTTASLTIDERRRGDSNALLECRDRTEPRASTLSSYRNEWVALSGETVVAHGSDAADVVRQARRAGVQHPHVLFVEELPEGVARLGL